MTREAVLAWLARREPAPPQALEEHLSAVVRNTPLPLPDHLALHGAELLARVAAATPQSRGQALDLLAADAFVTYAFEAQAEADPSGIGALADRAAAVSG